MKIGGKSNQILYRCGCNVAAMEKNGFYDLFFFFFFFKRLFTGHLSIPATFIIFFGPHLLDRRRRRRSQYYCEFHSYTRRCILYVLIRLYCAFFPFGLLPYKCLLAADSLPEGAFLFRTVDGGRGGGGENGNIIYKLLDNPRKRSLPCALRWRQERLAGILSYT